MLESVADVDRVIAIEDLIEIEHAVKVPQAVSVGLPHFTAFDQLKDNPAEIVRAADSPAIKHRLGHHAKLVQREIANPLKQFLPGNMRFLLFRIGSLLAALETLLRKSQRLKHKLVGVLMKA
jgi:hypothetical protein